MKASQKYVYQMFTHMTIFWNYGPHTPGQARLAAEALTGKINLTTKENVFKLFVLVKN